MRFVVLCSSKGTVLRAVIERIQIGDLGATCLGLVTDSEGRGCIGAAEAAGLPVVTLKRISGEAREDYDRRLDAGIRSLGADNETLIACMGWTWMLSPWFVSAYRNRILNVHPSLLPKHPGAHAHALVLAAKDTESGMTIHLIDEGMDTGKILLQKTCPVHAGDTEADLKERVQALEREWYPKVLQMIEKGEMVLPS